jgi:hypothetical protein
MIPNYLDFIVQPLIEKYQDLFLGAVMRKAELDDIENIEDVESPVNLDTAWSVDAFFWNEEEGEYGITIVLKTAESTYPAAVEWMKRVRGEHYDVN